MTNKKDRHDADDSEQLYVEDLLKMMSMQEYPPFIERLLSQMQGSCGASCQMAMRSSV